MDNEDRVEATFEPRPGFDLVKYGNVFTFNFNQEFAQRFRNVLADCEKNHNLQGQILACLKTLRQQMDFEVDDVSEDIQAQFDLHRFHHVYTVVCERDFAQDLNQVLTQFLMQKRVSPALFSFAKQLEGALYPKRFDSKTRYADEF